MKRNKKKFKRLTENENIELDNFLSAMNHPCGFGPSYFTQKNVKRMDGLLKRRRKEEQLARQKFEESLEDKAYKWL
jgi:uncharacterized protein YutD